MVIYKKKKLKYNVNKECLTPILGVSNLLGRLGHIKREGAT